MNAKNTKKSPIHENADANITCDFGDISHSRSRLIHTHTRIASSIIVRYNDYKGPTYKKTSHFDDILFNNTIND